MAGMTSRAPEERGFTMIELMVVVLIIAILLLLGIPSYLGARERANDRAVQSNVRNAFTATRVFYNESLEYTEDAAKMRAVEPSLDWTTTVLDASSPQAAIFIKTYDQPTGTTKQTVVVIGRTNTGRCFYLRDVMGGSIAGTYYDRQGDSSGTCPVPVDPATVAAGSWTH